MNKNYSHSNFGERSADLVYMCGHAETIYYNGKMTVYALMAHAEKNLCHACKEKKLKKENVHTFVPIWYYNEHLKRSRNIVKGKRNDEAHEIELWIPMKKYREFLEYRDRIYYEIHNSPIQNNRCRLSILVRGKKTYDIKDKLKDLGAKWKKWNNKYMCWVFYVDIIVDIDDQHNISIPYKGNSEYYSLKNELEKLGCIADFSHIRW